MDVKETFLEGGEVGTATGEGGGEGKGEEKKDGEREKRALSDLSGKECEWVDLPGSEIDGPKTR